MATNLTRPRGDKLLIKRYLMDLLFCGAARRALIARFAALEGGRAAASGVAAAREEVVNERGDDEAGRTIEIEAADNGDGERLKHLRAGAERKGQRHMPQTAARAVITMGRRRRCAA